MKAAILSTASLSLFLTGCCNIDDLMARGVPFSSCMDGDKERINDDKLSLGLNNACTPRMFESTCAPLFPDEELRCKSGGLYYGPVKVEADMAREDICYEGTPPPTPPPDSECAPTYTEFGEGQTATCRRCRADSMEIDPSTGLCVFTDMSNCSGAAYNSYGYVCIITDGSSDCPENYERMMTTPVCFATDNPYGFYSKGVNSARNGTDCTLPGVSTYNDNRQIISNNVAVNITEGVMTLPTGFNGGVYCSFRSDDAPEKLGENVTCTNGALSPTENDFRAILGQCVNTTATITDEAAVVAAGVSQAATPTHCIVDGILEMSAPTIASRECEGSAGGVTYNMWNAALNIIEIPRGSSCTFDVGNCMSTTQTLTCSEMGAISGLQAAADMIATDCGGR